MAAEIDQAIKEKYLYYQGLESKMDGLRQRWTNHDRRISNLPPIVKPVVSFLDGFRGLEGHDRMMSWQQETMKLFREITDLMKNNPAMYELTHLNYTPYSNQYFGFPQFSYGFRRQINGETLEKPFDQPLLFFGNGILARRGERNVPLIEIRKDEPPLLHLPEDFAFIITKHKAITEIDINPDEPKKAYAAWRPEVSYTPRAIKIPEDIVIPWRSSEAEAERFSDTEEVPNLKYEY